ncbi:MAG: hypothetical protein IT438_00495 [Phycisphaerales bacterium]|nr:hypothetical protein [Phycisphaerales bacterium]
MSRVWTNYWTLGTIVFGIGCLSSCASHAPDNPAAFVIDQNDKQYVSGRIPTDRDVERLIIASTAVENPVPVYWRAALACSRRGDYLSASRFVEAMILLDPSLGQDAHITAFLEAMIEKQSAASQQ